MLSDGVKWNVYAVVDEEQYKGKGGNQDVYQPKLAQIKKQGVGTGAKKRGPSRLYTNLRKARRRRKEVNRQGHGHGNANRARANNWYQQRSSSASCRPSTGYVNPLLDDCVVTS